jgi:hypothetical protein
MATAERDNMLPRVSALVLPVMTIILAAGCTAGTSPTSLPDASPAPTESSPTALGSASPPLCRSADLVYVSEAPGAAMGTTYSEITLRNRSGHDCVLQGSPVVTYQQQNGSTADLPIEPQTNAATVVVQAGGTVEFSIGRPGQGAGNTTSGPSCIHNGTYPNIALQLADGSVPLGNNSLTVWCGSITVLGWQVPGQ